MKITEEQVRHVADLARLHLDRKEAETFAAQLGTILEYVETLDRVDTTGVPPTSHAISLTNAFREDVAGEHLGPDAALENAPERESDYFVVPRVIA